MWAPIQERWAFPAYLGLSSPTASLISNTGANSFISSFVRPLHRLQLHSPSSSLQPCGGSGRESTSLMGTQEMMDMGCGEWRSAAGTSSGSEVSACHKWGWGTFIRDVCVNLLAKLYFFSLWSPFSSAGTPLWHKFPQTKKTNHMRKTHHQQPEKHTDTHTKTEMEKEKKKKKNTKPHTHKQPPPTFFFSLTLFLHM